MRTTSAPACLLMGLLSVSGCRAVSAEVHVDEPGAASSSSEAPAVFIETPEIEQPEAPERAASASAEPEQAVTPGASEPPDASNPDAEAAAKEAYAAGVERFMNHDYAGALAYFEVAHAHVALPALLYNIAHCHEELGHRIEACEAYFDVEADPRADAGVREDAKRSRARLGC